MANKHEVNAFLSSTARSFESTPYASYLGEAVEYNGVRNRGLLYEILKNPSITEEARKKAQEKLKSPKWDEPRIISTFDLRSEQEADFGGFDYKTEVKKTMHFLLREDTGLLRERPAHIYHEMQSKSTQDALSILFDNLKYGKERARVQRLMDLDQFPIDEFLIARYLSADIEDKIVAKIWDRDPKKDMSKSEELFCCTLPKHGPEYLVDPDSSMLDFFCDGERQARAILVPCEDKQLMVDSIERNSSIIDNHHSHQDAIRNFIARTILKQAGDCGFESVFFNTACYKQDVLPEKIRYETLPIRLTLRPIFRVRRIDMKDDYYIEGFKSKGGIGYVLKEFFTRKYEVTGKKVNVGENIETES